VRALGLGSGVLRLPPGHSHSCGLLLAHVTGLVDFGKAVACFAPPGPPGNMRRRSSAIPARQKAWAPRAFLSRTRIEEAPHAPRVGAGAAPPPPKQPPCPYRLPLPPNTPSQVGAGGNTGHLGFGRARCPFPPPPRPYSAVRSPQAQALQRAELEFAARSCLTAPVLDAPNGFWPRWVGPLGGLIYARQSLGPGPEPPPPPRCPQLSRAFAFGLRTWDLWPATWGSAYFQAALLYRIARIWWYCMLCSAR
jgi:hypothetical protein